MHKSQKMRSLVETSVVASVPATRTRYIFVITAISKLGTLNYEIDDGTISGDKFIAYIVNMKRLCNEREILNPIFILQVYIIIIDFKLHNRDAQTAVFV